MLKRELRLGDTLDDYCVRCRLLTNHTVVAMVATQVGKVRCETCYFEHEFRNGEGGKKKAERSEKKAS
ncbi:MAG TPA: hypothetical protein VGK99_11770 [Acidobacteriota bacterium]|jgi:hypothetical protein